MEIEIVRTPISNDRVKEHAQAVFGDMAKIVVDVERGVLAMGGTLHADAERVLLDDGSKQEDLWGANVYPDKAAEDRLEYTSLINIRPAQGNRSQEITDTNIRAQVRAVVDRLLLS